MTNNNKALVVDDDPMVRGLVSGILQERGFQVVTAEDGQQGVKLIEMDANYQLIILDVVMPNMSGLEALARIRLDAKAKEIPVIMLTAEDRCEDILGAYNVGADYYITKPFTRQQLLLGIDLVLGN